MKHFDSISERLLNLRPTHETPSKNPAPVATISTQRDVDLTYVAREYEKSSTFWKEFVCKVAPLISFLLGNSFKVKNS